MKKTLPCIFVTGLPVVKMICLSALSEVLLYDED